MNAALMSPEPAALAAPGERIDELEQWMLDNFPPVDMPVTHRFTPGLYAREIFMPAGSLLTSKIHRTEHPFVVLSGKVRVLLLEGEDVVGVVELGAGHVGVTKPGTRRVLLILEDCRWVTFHPLTEEESAAQDVAMIEERIIEPRLLHDGSTMHKRYLEALGLQVPAPAPLLPQYEYGGAP